MKALHAARIIITNVVILAIIWAILQDDAGRVAYFQSLGFTTSTSYYPFFYVTSASNQVTRIPGLLTLDWTQVLAAVLFVLDLGFLLPYFRRRPEAQKLPDVPSAAV